MISTLQKAQTKDLSNKLVPGEGESIKKMFWITITTTMMMERCWHPKS